MTQTALIWGVTGQIGSFLADLLVSKGYEVHGVVRRASTINTSRIDHLYEKKLITLHYGDLLDSDSIRRVLELVVPDEVYNLAAQSHVRVSFDTPVATCEVDAIGPLKLFNAIGDLRPGCRVYQASSSEMFGSSPSPQNEQTPFRPRSPYGCAKVFAYHAARNYRDAYGMFIVNGIMFNAESERRGETFVTRKITRAVGRIVQGLQQNLVLGNLTARRDWGYAGDYVDAMWRSLQKDDPDDYVIGTGESHDVTDFLRKAFDLVGRDWADYVEIDDTYMRPTEVDDLRADTSYIRAKLGWSHTMSFGRIVEKMVTHDLELAKTEFETRPTKTMQKLSKETP